MIKQHPKRIIRIVRNNLTRDERIDAGHASVSRRITIRDPYIPSSYRSVVVRISIADSYIPQMINIIVNIQPQQRIIIPFRSRDDPQLYFIIGGGSRSIFPGISKLILEPIQVIRLQSSKELLYLYSVCTVYIICYLRVLSDLIW